MNSRQADESGFTFARLALATIVLVATASATSAAPLAVAALAVTPPAGVTTVQLTVDGDLYLDATGFHGTSVHLDAARAVILGDASTAWPLTTGTEVVGGADLLPIAVTGDVLFALDQPWEGGLLNATATGNIHMRGLGDAHFGPSSLASAHAVVFAGDVFGGLPATLSLSAKYIHFASSGELPDIDDLGPHNALVAAGTQGVTLTSGAPPSGSQGFGAVTFMNVGAGTLNGVVGNMNSLVGGAVYSDIVLLDGDWHGLVVMAPVVVPLPPAAGLLAVAMIPLLRLRRRENETCR